ncbi:MAG TPA: hypothetical protein VIX82_16815 [Solirubrobacteraceae bacterium]
MSFSVMDAHDLYGLPLDRFVPERGALAKELRKQGRREQAAEVAGLRKPSVGAWAVNQLVRTQGPSIAELFEAGDGLQQAHSELLAGRGDGAALRSALSRERSVVNELVQTARGLLSSEGHGLTQTTLDRVSETLHAAAFDAEARTQVKQASLDRELRHIGLGAGGELSTQTPAPRTTKSRARGESSERARSTPAPGDAEPRPAPSGRERTKRVVAAGKAEADARRAAQRADRELRVAEERRDHAAQSLRDAEAAVAAARQRAEEASLAHRDAERALASP